MKINFKKILVAVVLIPLFLCNCTKVELEPRDPANEREFARLCKEADSEFVKMHLAGWYRACDNYERALQLRSDQTVREKLFFSLILKVIREKQYFMKNFKDLEKARILAETVSDFPLKETYKIAELMVNSEYFYPKYKKEDLSTAPFEKYNNVQHLMYMKILTLIMKKDFKAYRDAVHDLKDKFPDSGLWEFLRLNPANIKRVRGILERFPDFIEMKLICANRSYREGKLRDSLKIYREILNKHPQFSEALNGIAKIYLDAGLNSEALRLYKRAEKLSPLYYRPVFGAAQALSNMRKFTDSNRYLSLIIDKKMNYIEEAYYQRALNYFQAESFERAIEDIIKAEPGMKNRFEFNYLAGLINLGIKKFKNAYRYFLRAEKIYPASGDCLFYKADTEIRMQRYNKAVKSFVKAAQNYSAVLDSMYKKINSKDEFLSVGKEMKSESMLSLRKEQFSKKLASVIKNLESVKAPAGKKFSSDLKKVSSILKHIKTRYEKYVLSLENK